MTKLNRKQIENFYLDLYAQYKKGASLSDLGRINGISRQAISDYFKRKGWPLRSRSEAQKNAISKR